MAACNGARFDICQFFMGRCYYEGVGVTKDYKKALELFLASEDLVYSRLYIGDCYLYGYGVEMDYNEAIKYYEDCTFRGGDFRLGTCYAIGLGVKKSKEKALELYDDAIPYLEDFVDANDAPYNMDKEMLEEVLRDYKRLFGKEYEPC